MTMTRSECRARPSSPHAVDPRHTLGVSGELDIVTAPALRSALHRLDDADTHAITVDLSRLTFIGAAGLAVLIEARNTCRCAGRDLAVTGATGQVRRVFELTGLQALLADQ